MSSKLATLGQWLELSELLRRTLSSAIDELTLIVALQQRMATELTDQIHGLAEDGNALAMLQRRYGMVAALQIEDEVQQRQVHIQEMLETVSGALSELDNRTRSQFGELVADGNLHRHWQARILERQTLAELRERVEKKLSDPLANSA